MERASQWSERVNGASESTSRRIDRHIPVPGHACAAPAAPAAPAGPAQLAELAEVAPGGCPLPRANPRTMPLTSSSTQRRSADHLASSTLQPSANNTLCSVRLAITFKNPLGLPVDGSSYAIASNSIDSGTQCGGYLNLAVSRMSAMSCVGE